MNLLFAIVGAEGSVAPVRLFAVITIICITQVGTLWAELIDRRPIQSISSLQRRGSRLSFVLNLDLGCRVGHRSNCQQSELISTL